MHLRASALPEGTITFLRSDVEGSMELIGVLGARYDELNAAHLAQVRSAIGQHGGHVVRTEGDGCFAVFSDAGAAARAAIEIQRAMTGGARAEGQALRLRIGLHSGVGIRVGDDYGGFEVSRAARIAACGWGGQIVISDATRALLASASLPEATIRALGRHRLKGVPEPELLFQLDAPGLPVSFPQLRGRQASAEHLPDRRSAVIGRAPELDQLERLLETTRLLTLTGPGGSGKTTLALELAHRLADRYADGAWLVDLQAVHDADLVRAEIARGVGLLDGPAGRAEDRLDSYLGDRELLLVIDNFEQVIGAAGVIPEILSASGASRVIVTSRLALRLRAEQEFPVRPLRTAGDDGEQSAAVALFVDRVRRVRPEARLGVDELDTVAEICRRVDGLPLAIELCAARAAMLPIATILDRLRRHEPLPGTAPRDLPDRQRTIDRTVEWSVDLLAPPLHRLFARLAVFEESFDLEQAAQVAGLADGDADVLDGVVALVESSLLQRIDDPAGGVRFGWLQTIRDHAAALLALSGEADVMRARHARAYARLVTDDAPRLPGAAQRSWLLDRLAADDANLRAATLAAVELGDVESGLRLVGGLWRYWLQNGRLAEGRELTERVLAMPGSDAPTRERVSALDAAGSIAYWTGEMDRAALAYEEELALARELGDRPGEALALLDLFFLRVGDDPDGAAAARAEAAAILTELGDAFGLARLEQAAILLSLGGRIGDLDLDPASLELTAVGIEGHEDAWLVRLGPALRGYACLIRGEHEAAMRWLARSLRANLAVAERTDTAMAIQFGVVGVMLLGRPDLAAVIHGATLAAFEQLGVRPVATYEVLTGSDPTPAIEAILGPDAFAAAVDEGRRLSLEEAIDRLEETLEPAVGT